MINRLQKRFIIISVISIFSVILLMFSVIGVLSYISMNNTLDTLIDSISKGGGKFPDSFGVPQPFDKPDKDYGFITPETRYQTRFFTVWYNEDGIIDRIDTEFIYSVDETSAASYANSIKDDRNGKGWIENYRYNIFEKNGEVVIAFVDGSMNRAALLQSLVISFCVLLLFSSFVITLIIVFSKRAMKPIAESYDKQKQFITDANHELKTPLTLILANLDIASTELGENEWLEDIRFEGEKMTELINQLVSLSRMDEDENIVKDNLDLSEILLDTISEFNILAKKNDLELKTDIEGGINYNGDELLIRRLISILLDNAIKYSDNDGEIKISLKMKKHVILVVENTYKEVDTLMLDKLFDRFYRSDKSRSVKKGFGIGLSLAKSIVEKHNGELFAYKADNDSIGFKAILK